MGELIFGLGAFNVAFYGIKNITRVESSAKLEYCVVSKIDYSF